MNCQEVMEYMQRYLDQDLGKAETEQMHDHLRGCEQCSAMFERLVQLSDELEKLPKVTPSVSIVDSILPRLDELDQGSAKAVVAPRRKRFSYKAAGVVAAGIALGLMLMQWNPFGSEYADDGTLMKTSGAESMQSMEMENPGAPDLYVTADTADTADTSDTAERSNTTTDAADHSNTTNDDEMKVMTTSPEREDRNESDSFGIAAIPERTDKSKVSTSSPSIGNQNNEKAGIAAVEQPERFVSSDGLYIAYVYPSLIVITDNTDNVIAQQAIDSLNEEVRAVGWSGDSAVFIYETTRDNTTEQHLIDAANAQ